MKQSSNEVTVSTSEAAAQLNVDRHTITNMIADGRLKAKSERYGSREYFRVLQSSIDRLLALK